MTESSQNETIDLKISINDIKKYLQKLNILISNNSSFIIGKYRFINKNRVDDIICCMEASWPKEIKGLAQYKKEKNIESFKIYKNFLNIITNKTFISSNHYLINYSLFKNRYNILIKSLNKDLNINN